jgi:hypothetical protein
MCEKHVPNRSARLFEGRHANRPTHICDSFITVSGALYGFCTVPRGDVFHLRGHASETILHRATIIDARPSGTRERSACTEVSAEVHINYYTGDCIPDEGLSKNPGEEKPATGGNLAENHRGFEGGRRSA